MIAYLKGKIVFKNEKFIILLNGGVGYKVFLLSCDMSYPLFECRLVMKPVVLKRQSTFGSYTGSTRGLSKMKNTELPIYVYFGRLFKNVTGGCGGISED